jgi:hypothetical protein
MKHILQNIAVFSISVFISLGAVKAQTTILERDGANNEFVVADWTLTSSFANPNQVNITSGNDGTLAIANTSAYTDIQVEIHFSQSQTISFDLELKAPAINLTQIGVISDNSGAVNKAIVSFSNSLGLPLNEMIISNPNMTVGIIYLKITGVLDGSSSVMNEDIDSFDVTVNQESLILNSETEGTLNIFNNVGQLQSTHTISKGQNTVMNSTKGLSFLVLTNSRNGLISRKKIMR